MLPSFLYISLGRIFLKEPGKEAKPIESIFARSMIDRAQQIRQRNAWKTQGFGARFMSGGMPWSDSQDDPDQAELPVVINSVSRGIRDGEILYSLASGEIGGVFSIDLSGENERRLLHTADFRINELNASASEDRIACVIRTKAGSHIAVMRGDGGELSDVTQGDSVDASPLWVPGTPHEMLYQSAGIARNGAGMAVGTSASQIMKVRIDSGTTEVLLGDAQHDYLGPKFDALGNLYCIRKPHESLTPSFNPFRVIWDLVLMPVRLLFALFQFMNFFTMRYTGKTLVSSGDLRQRHIDPRQMLIMENLLHARGAKSLFAPHRQNWKVSRSWTLVKKPTTGAVESIATGVLTFDLCGDGSILYSNGNRIFARTPDGETEEILKEQFISQVLALPTAPQP
ncbi:MAG TPA: hypothetical protein VKE93_02155 [Candidatus Angelobacter sp.]|nr:hypothetical protein [Candidatus Angelobacter sp.]